MKGTVEGYVEYVLRHRIIRDEQLVLPPVCSNGGWAPLERADRDKAVVLLREAGILAEWEPYGALRVTKLTRYEVKVSWWELVEPPRWMAGFWMTEMIWNLSVHRSCNLFGYYWAENPRQAEVLAYEFVIGEMPGPQARVLVGRAQRVK